jgi:hypothetical protein
VSPLLSENYSDNNEGNQAKHDIKSAKHDIKSAKHDIKSDGTHSYQDYQGSSSGSGSGCVLCKPLFTRPHRLKARALLKNQAKHDIKKVKLM